MQLQIRHVCCRLLRRRQLTLFYIILFDMIQPLAIIDSVSLPRNVDNPLCIILVEMLQPLAITTSWLPVVNRHYSLFPLVPDLSSHVWIVSSSGVTIFQRLKYTNVWLVSGRRGFATRAIDPSSVDSLPRSIRACKNQRLQWSPDKDYFFSIVFLPPPPPVALHRIVAVF